MTELQTIFEASGMTERDFAYALGIRLVSLEKMLSGEWMTPDGVIDDANDMLERMAKFRGLIEHFPWVLEMNYKECKSVLQEAQCEKEHIL